MVYLEPARIIINSYYWRRASVQSGMEGYMQINIRKFVGSPVII